MSGISPLGGPKAGQSAALPGNYQETIRAYVASHVPNGEGAKIDFYQAPNWAVHGYRAIFSVRTRESLDPQMMYAEFRDDVIVGVGPYDPPNTSN